MKEYKDRPFSLTQCSLAKDLRLYSGEFPFEGKLISVSS